MGPLPYARAKGGVRLAVRVTPRASRNAVEGVRSDGPGGPHLRIRLKAPPVDGAANEALIRFLADLLDLRSADIAIASGETGRTKLLLLGGDPERVEARLAALLSET